MKQGYFILRLDIVGLFLNHCFYKTEQNILSFFFFVITDFVNLLKLQNEFHLLKVSEDEMWTESTMMELDKECTWFGTDKRQKFFEVAIKVTSKTEVIVK